MSVSPRPVARAAPGDSSRAALSATLRAEWAKARTVPDLALSLMLTVVATLAVSITAAAVAGQTPDRVRISLLGLQLGQAVVAVAGVQLLAGEYGTGLIRATLLALPRRRTVLAAKALLLTGGTAPAAAVAVAGSAVAGRLLLDDYPALWAGSVLRATTGSVLYLCLIALLGLGVAAVVRNATAAAGLVLSLLYVLPAVVRLLPDQDWARALYRLSPSTAGQTIQSTVDTAALPIAGWPGLAVTAAWTAGALALGALALSRRDQG